MRLITFMEYHDKVQWVTMHRWLETPAGLRPARPLYNAEDPPVALCALLCASLRAHLPAQLDASLPYSVSVLPDNACAEVRTLAESVDELSWLMLDELLTIPWLRALKTEVTGSDARRAIMESVGIATHTSNGLVCYSTPRDLWGEEWITNVVVRLRDIRSVSPRVRIYTARCP